MAITPLSTESSPSEFRQERRQSWVLGDALDKRILQLALPAILNNMIIPLVGAADTFWVGRMKNALALAGQGAANQVSYLSM
jgi:Na+-driven multidrug efflux pump